VCVPVLSHTARNRGHDPSVETDRGGRAHDQAAWPAPGARARPRRCGANRGRARGDVTAAGESRNRRAGAAGRRVQIRFSRPRGLLDGQPQPDLETEIARVVLALDEGTTGATAIAVGLDGEVRGKGYTEITQHYPRPGWVEHDPNEIWSAVQSSAKQALDVAGVSQTGVAAVGITNQRETLVLWDRKTLEPIAPAIVWQDRRTADECRRLLDAGHEERVREVTGLVLDPYFTATKYAWALQNIDRA